MKQFLSDAVDDFMVLRSSQDLRKGSLNNERGVLKRLLEVNGNIWVHNMTEVHVTRYFEHAGRTRSPNSLQLDYGVLGNFFDWARRTKRMPLTMDPMAHRRRPKSTYRERNRLPASRFPDLLDAAGRRHLRDRAAVAVLLYLLVRDQEAADIRVGDVMLEEQCVRVRITKSRTEDWMPMSTELEDELRSWLSWYSANVSRPLNHNDYLLPAMRSVGTRRDDAGRIGGHNLVIVQDAPISSLRPLVKKALEAIDFPLVDSAGKPLFEGSHTIRRSAARALFERLSEAGYDKALRHVKEMMHHAKVSTTETYIGVIEDRRSRDEVLRGKPMFPVAAENVVPLAVTSGHGGTGDQGQGV